MPLETPAEELLAALKTKHGGEWKTLQELADWVEDYEKHEGEFIWGKRWMETK